MYICTYVKFYLGILFLASMPCSLFQSTYRSVTMPERYSKDLSLFLNSCLRQVVIIIYA